MKIHNPTLEERAFLYQEVQDLETLIRDFGSLSVLVEETKNHRYRVTFMVAPESVGMRVRAVDDNIFDAAIAAKTEVKKQLSAIVNSMPRSQHVDGVHVRIPIELLH